MPSILLASNSPRRKELLALTGLPFVILPVNVDETPKPKEDPESCARRLAETKAQTAINQAEAMGFPTDQLILASDTIVVMDGEILGKPVDEEDAKRMLKILKGKTHQVITAICIQRTHSEERATDVCISPVPMRKYTDDEITAYIETGDPLDKAGAYAIQHSGFHPVHGMKDCYASVMGLPLCHVSRLMTRFGISSDDETPTACQQYLNYKCPVFFTILGKTE